MSNAGLLGLNDLPKYQTRRVVPEDVKLTDAKVVVGGL
jgi:hypothetical protein